MLNDNRLQAADLIEQFGIEKFMDRNADAAADSVDGTQTDVVIIAAHKLPQGRFRNIADLAKRKQRKIILRTYFSDPFSYRVAKSHELLLPVSTLHYSDWGKVKQTGNG